MRQKNRSFRILKMITVLSGRQQSWTAQEMAKFFEISIRTFHRDREIIEDLGVPIYFNQETHSYEILDDFKFTPPKLNSAEAKALLLAAREHYKDGFVYSAELKTASSKVMSSLPESFQNNLKDLNEMISYKDSPHINFSEHKESIEDVERGIEGKRTIKIKYFS
jgi:predicted DNA-binding transcriptional regulator YafY